MGNVDDRKDVSASWAKKLFFVTIIFVFCVASIEILFRVFFVFQVGPSILLYGMQERAEVSAEKRAQKNHSVMFHDNVIDNYSKYHPYQKRVDHDHATGEIYDITINNLGFRGEDVETEKGNNVIRIVTLGASSTFGYGNRDTTTYPYYMEKYLNEKNELAKSYEVINLGVPHLNSNQIRSLFLNEALELQPDIVTFYEGANDTGVDFGALERSKAVDMLRNVNAIKAVYNELRLRLVLVKYIHHLRSERLHKYDSKSLSRQMEGEANNFDENLQEKGLKNDRRKQFIENLSVINSECKKRDIVFIVANQQLRSGIVPNENIRSVTYQQEWEMVNRKLSEQGFLNRTKLHIYFHKMLMDDEKHWALENDVPFVDVIEALNTDRDVLISWVHLSPRGNQMVADLLVEKIVDLSCD